MPQRDAPESIAAVRELGYAIVAGQVDAETVAALRPMCTAALARARRARTRVPLEALSRAPLRGGLFPERSAVSEIVRGCLGQGARVTEYWIRASPPGSRAQTIHRDRSQILAADSDLPKLAALSIDLAVTDLSDENGATEIWPRSHLERDVDRTALLDGPRRAGRLPSCRLVVPSGGVTIRDLRAWHRAMPNRTEESRIILSVTYERG